MPLPALYSKPETTYVGRTLNQNHSNDEKCGDNNTKDEDEKEREGASFIYAKEASCQCCQLCTFLNNIKTFCVTKVGK